MGYSTDHAPTEPHASQVVSLVINHKLPMILWSAKYQSPVWVSSTPHFFHYFSGWIPIFHGLNRRDWLGHVGQRIDAAAFDVSGARSWQNGEARCARIRLEVTNGWLPFVLFCGIRLYNYKRNIYIYVYIYNYIHYNCQYLWIIMNYCQHL